MLNHACTSFTEAFNRHAIDRRVAPHRAHAARVPHCAAQVETEEESSAFLTPDEPANEEPVPEQKEPEAVAPALAVPTSRQLAIPPPELIACDMMKSDRLPL